ncbi:hypothetical protein CDAR_280371 [Caerostris darwini]|uniref:Uncharacterized protein n=1 Tax=Caerostris darwini TaxID=1538125 RepID=A0AAV4VFP9_9ARAC|nr:hypothetical protein CDAR_280371 [Caerostris darwini]
MPAYLWPGRVKTPSAPRGCDLFVAFAGEKNEFEDFLFGFHYWDLRGAVVVAPGQRLLTFPWRGLPRKEKMSYAPGLLGPGGE